MSRHYIKATITVLFHIITCAVNSRPPALLACPPCPRVRPARVSTRPNPRPPQLCTFISYVLVPVLVGIRSNTSRMRLQHSPTFSTSTLKHALHATLGVGVVFEISDMIRHSLVRVLLFCV